MIYVGIAIALIIVAIAMIFVPYRNTTISKVVDTIAILCCIGALLCTFLYNDVPSSDVATLNVYVDGARTISLDIAQCQELNYYETNGYIKYKKLGDDSLYYYYIPTNAVVQKE